MNNAAASERLRDIASARRWRPDLSFRIGSEEATIFERLSKASDDGAVDSWIFGRLLAEAGAGRSKQNKAFPGDVEGHGKPLDRRDARHARCAILHDTLERLATPELRQHFQALAARNVKRWAAAAAARKGAAAAAATTAARKEEQCVIEVSQGDWGEVTHALTKKYGVTFAALNMANAFSFGGAYERGAAAQEENMFRRSDCHFHDEGYDRSRHRYSPEMHDLISGRSGQVYLDTTTPRVCIKGREKIIGGGGGGRGSGRGGSGGGVRLGATSTWARTRSSRSTSCGARRWTCVEWQRRPTTRRSSSGASPPRSTPAAARA